MEGALFIKYTSSVFVSSREQFIYFTLIWMHESYE